MYSIDRDNFKRFLLEFPAQIVESRRIYNLAKPDIDLKKMQNIIYLGMGGSAIAGDVFRSTFFDRLKYPMQIIRGYQCPAYCNHASLVIASSYSGNTEETLAATVEAHEKGGKIIVITSGGKLKQLAKKNGWRILEIPGGYPPRQAFGYSFFPLLHTLNALLNQAVSDDQITNVVKLVKAVIKRNDEQTSEGKSLAKELALKIHNRVPIIYTSAPYLEPIALRWRTQLQENSKSMAFSNAIPEMNHNEIVGWEMDHKCLERFIVIFLEGSGTHPRVRARIELTKNIIQDRGAEIASIYTEGNSWLEQAISLVCKGDWVSYYLALIYEKNPVSILNIDFLKAELEKLGNDL